MLKKFFSYFWPITKTVNSDYNDKLYINWYNGKKTLDSKQTNYSYGSLQKLWTYGLSKIEINRSSEILLLGLGGGCVIQWLRQNLDCHQKIHAVEIDPKIIAIAQEEFGITAGDNLEIHQADAYEYVQLCKNKFGIILIDIFIDNEVPQKFYSLSFWNALFPLLAKNGSILFNAGLTKEAVHHINCLKQEFSILKFRQLQPLQLPNQLWVIKKPNPF